MCVPQVYYRHDRTLQDAEEKDEQEQVLMFSGNCSEGRLPGLRPYSVYSLFIKVLNNKGEGPPSPTETFETPEGGGYDWSPLKWSCKECCFLKDLKVTMMVFMDMI